MSTPDDAQVAALVTEIEAREDFLYDGGGLDVEAIAGWVLEKIEAQVAATVAAEAQVAAVRALIVAGEPAERGGWLAPVFSCANLAAALDGVEAPAPIVRPCDCETEDGVTFYCDAHRPIAHHHDASGAAVLGGVTEIPAVIEAHAWVGYTDLAGHRHCCVHQVRCLDGRYRSCGQFADDPVHGSAT